MIAKYKAVLFDFDGTLVDTSEGVFNSILYSLEHFGIKETDMSRLDYFVGPPLWHSFMHQYNVDNVTADEMVEKYREHYKVTGLYQSKLYDGMEEALKTLYDNGVKIAVASSKPEVFITELLNKFNVMKYFSFISAITFKEKNADKKIIIENAVKGLGLKMTDGILMVGDRHFDIVGANQNNIDSVGVLYGFGSKEEFEEAGATYTIETPSELKNIVFK